MSQIKLDIPDDMLLALKVTERQLAEELKMYAAVKLYELGRLSSGAAAQLAGIPRCLFLTRLGDYGVATFRLSEKELIRDLENA
jgi:predicted HTH domain antitoxin